MLCGIKMNVGKEEGYKTKKLIIGVLTIGALITGCAKTETTTEEPQVIKLKPSYTFDFEYGNKVYKSDFQDKLKYRNLKNFKVKINGQKLDESKEYEVGEYTATLSADNCDTRKFEMKIKDTTAPTITQVTKDTSLNSADDFTTYFTSEDKSESSITAVDTSNLDLATAGTYTVAVTATDIYDNATTSDFTITVHDYAAEEAAAAAEAKKKEAELTTDEENKAEEKAILYLSNTYDVHFGFTAPDYCIKYSVSDTEYEIEYAINGKINKVQHRFLVRLSSNQNHEVDAITSVVIDGVRVSG